VQDGDLVILESTSPVGTTEELVAPIARSAGARPLVAYAPERVLPGRILCELIENDRVVGGVDAASTAAAVEFYSSFVTGVVRGTSVRAAEMVKLAENAFRDVNIAYANELALLCEREGLDAREVIELANCHPRVSILQPGPGVGGHCIAVDPWFLVARAPDLARLVRSAREVNDAQPGRVVARVREAAHSLERPRIACLGLTFKADIDDLRESPALEIVRELAREGVGELLVCEPHLTSHAEFALVDAREAIARADIVLVLVDHAAFRTIPRSALAGKLLVDTRGLFP
jgi:UDP-N-acetyl-D-mannosaminuronic acid dehydrogenase